MLRTLINVFQVAELRTKILFTIGMLAVYRIGFWVPLPGVNQEQLSSYFQKALSEGNAAGRAAQFVAIFSGGNFAQSTIFGLGIMPYISASIIFQLLAAVYPALKKIQEEGPTGRQKIQDWTRRATVVLCVIQAIGWLTFIAAQNMVYPEWRSNPLWWVMAVGTLTAGTVFLMWLGEQIDRFGIGNGVSMLIMAGILTGMPGAIMWIYNNFDPGEANKMGWGGLLMLAAGFLVVVAGSVLLTVAQRRIPVQQAKHTRGRRVYGGQRSYLPLRVNHGGVMPVIFASSLMIFPSVIFGSLAQAAGADGAGAWAGLARWLSTNFSFGQFPYVLCEVILIIFFSYFWITVQFNPEEMSKQLRDHGSFIPGLRPGPRTAEYLESVMGRITFVGAAMLAVIAVAPMIVNRALNIDFAVTQFLGGTGLLIVVSVSLDFLQKVEANLMMRNYQGFLSGEEPSGGGSTRRLRSARG